MEFESKGEAVADAVEEAKGDPVGGPGPAVATKVKYRGKTRSLSPEFAKNQKKKDQFGYIVAGLARGPVSINGVFVSSLILRLANLDAYCQSNNGVSSGADGLACTPDNWWNETLWVNGAQGYGGNGFNGTNSSAAMGGLACRAKDEFGAYSYFNLDTPDCLQAFADYRNVSASQKIFGTEDMVASVFGPGAFTCKYVDPLAHARRIAAAAAAATGSPPSVVLLFGTLNMSRVLWRWLRYLVLGFGAPLLTPLPSPRPALANTPPVASCSSDFSYITGGFRPSTMITLTATVENICAGLILPFWGGWLDTTTLFRYPSPHGGQETRARLTIWKMVTAAVVLCHFGLMVLGTGYLWTVSLAVITCMGVVYELMWLSLVAFLPECAETPAEQTAVSSKSSGWNIAAQVLGALIFTGVGMIIPEGARSLTTWSPTISQEVLAIIVGCAFTAAWMAGFSTVSARNLSHRGVKEDSEKKRGVCGTLHDSFKEAGRPAQLFLVYHMFASQGVLAVIATCGTYFIEVAKLTTFQVGVATLLCLIFAAPSSFAIVPILKRMKMKSFLIMMHACTLALIVVVPFWCNREGMFIEACICCIGAGVLLGFYFAAEIAAFSGMIPQGKETSMYALYSFASMVLRWAPTAVYTAVAQTTGAHTWAFLSIGIWVIFALVTLVCFVSFDPTKITNRMSVYDTGDFANAIGNIDFATPAEKGDGEGDTPGVFA